MHGVTMKSMGHLWVIQENNEVLGEKPVPVPVFHHKSDMDSLGTETGFPVREAGHKSPEPLHGRYTCKVKISWEFNYRSVKYRTVSYDIWFYTSRTS